MASTDIEKKSLEAHVELCAERYNNLDARLQSLHERMGNVEKIIIEIKESLASAPDQSSRQIISIGTTVVGVLMTAIVSLAIHFVLK